MAMPTVTRPPTIAGRSVVGGGHDVAGRTGGTDVAVVETAVVPAEVPVFLLTPSGKDGSATRPTTRTPAATMRCRRVARRRTPGRRSGIGTRLYKPGLLRPGRLSPSTRPGPPGSRSTSSV